MSASSPASYTPSRPVRHGGMSTAKQPVSNAYLSAQDEQQDREFEPIYPEQPEDAAEFGGDYKEQQQEQEQEQPRDDGPAQPEQMLLHSKPVPVKYLLDQSIPEGKKLQYGGHLGEECSFAVLDSRADLGEVKIDPSRLLETITYVPVEGMTPDTRQRLIRFIDNGENGAFSDIEEKLHALLVDRAKSSDYDARNAGRTGYAGSAPGAASGTTAGQHGAGADASGKKRGRGRGESDAAKFFPFLQVNGTFIGLYARQFVRDTGMPERGAQPGRATAQERETMLEREARVKRAREADQQRRLFYDLYGIQGGGDDLGAKGGAAAAGVKAKADDLELYIVTYTSPKKYCEDTYNMVLRDTNAGVFDSAGETPLEAFIAEEEKLKPFVRRYLGRLIKIYADYMGLRVKTEVDIESTADEGRELPLRAAIDKRVTFSTNYVTSPSADEKDVVTVYRFCSQYVPTQTKVRAHLMWPAGPLVVYDRSDKMASAETVAKQDANLDGDYVWLPFGEFPPTFGVADYHGLVTAEKFAAYDPLSDEVQKRLTPLIWRVDGDKKITIQQRNIPINQDAWKVQHFLPISCVYRLDP